MTEEFENYLSLASEYQVVDSRALTELSREELLVELVKAMIAIEKLDDIQTSISEVIKNWRDDKPV